MLALIQAQAKSVGPLFGDDPHAAITNLINYRNYMLHRADDVSDEANYGESVYWKTQRLMFLMKACLLTELGFSDTEQSSFFDRHEEYAHLLGKADHQ